MHINDLPFKPQHTELALEAATEWFNDNVSRFRETTNFAIISDDGVAGVHIGASCHASMSTATDLNGKRALVATEIGIARAGRAFNGEYPDQRSTDPEVYYPFLKWFTQDSPFSRFIVNKDDWNTVRTKGIIVSADIPTQLFQNILIISRHFWECTTIPFKLFGEMMEKYPGNGMFFYNLLFCSNLSTFNGRPPYHGAKVLSVEADSLVLNMNGAHRAWSVCPTMEELNAFCSGEWGNSLEVFNRNYRDYASIYGGVYLGKKVDKAGNPVKVHGYGNTFIHDLILTNEEFKEGLKNFRGLSNKPDEVKNPFTPRTFANPTPNPANCTYSEIFGFVVPFIFEKGLVTCVA